jgi:hypothetical protein
MRNLPVVVVLAVAVAISWMAPADAGPTTTASLAKRVKALEKKVRALSALALLESTKGDPALKTDVQKTSLFVNSQGVGSATVVCLSGEATGGGFESTSAPGSVVIESSTPTVTGNWQVTVNSSRSNATVGNAVTICSSVERE